MKTNFDSLTKNWDFMRTLRVSVKFAVIYAALSAIWILIFGSKPEIVLEVKLLNHLTKIIILPWNSWTNLCLNGLSIVLFGFLFYFIINVFSLSKEQSPAEDSLFGLIIGFLLTVFVAIFWADPLVSVILGILLGVFVSIIINQVAGLSIGMGTGLFTGLFFCSGAGLGIGFGAGFLAGVGSNIIMGIILISFFIIKQPFSRKFWIVIGNGIVFFWNWLIK